MKSDQRQLSIPLSRLVPNRRNPRKVKPGRDAHQRLVALIRSQGLLQPLVVRATDDEQYEVVAGERRLKALREIHKGDGDPKIPCVLRDVDADTADAMSLGENFGREAMHPLDEAEAFAKLATAEGKDAAAIAAEFGVSEHYVRQRMKLATLAKPVKAAYRAGAIDTATAEAFAAVPELRQLAVWQELHGNPRHAEHVRNVIAHACVDAKHALFDLATLPDYAISRDLFGDRVLIERGVFLSAQSQALGDLRQTLTEEGWKEVVVGRREDVQDRLYAMDTPERAFDEVTGRKLATLAARREKFNRIAETIGDDDEVRQGRLQRKYEALEAQEQSIVEQAPEVFSEEVKALATAFLILDPDGQVHREYRVPRRRQTRTSDNGGHAGNGTAGDKPKVPTSEDLSDRQLAVTFTHQALAVREAILNDVASRRRVLALLLNERVRSEALDVRHEANGTTLHASTEGFSSSAFDRLRGKRSKFDPLQDAHHVDDVEAYERLSKLSPTKLDSLVDLLIVGRITAHPLRPTPLVVRLADELKVNVRDTWRPDAAWLSGFQKIQLAHLVVELKGPVHAPAPDAKKSALVDVLHKLFTEAAEGKLPDKQLAARVNSWLPSNLRSAKDETETHDGHSKNGG
jgi:ParB family chromosome partitioning protein